MNDKITWLPHWVYPVQFALVSCWEWLHQLTLYETALLMTVVCSPLALFASIYFQWRQTRAMEKGAREGKLIVKPRLFK